MKVVIAGSRTITDYEILLDAMSQVDWVITEVVSGLATGVDTLGMRWAKEKNIPVKEFRAEWELHGKAAGPIRNSQMAKYADAVIVIWDGESRGSKNMIEEAKGHGLELKVFDLKDLKKSRPLGPIKNNPVFGKEAIERSHRESGSIDTETVSLNNQHIVAYKDPKRNSRLTNMVLELVKEVNILKEK